jgi:hypothetical protein
VYGCWPADIDELKAEIQEEITHISEETLWEVRQNFPTHVHQSIQQNGCHLKDVLYKNSL